MPLPVDTKVFPMDAFSSTVRSMEIWLVLLLLLSVQLLFLALGYRIGACIRAGREEASRTPMTTVLGSSMGLLALLLGFSFSMAAGRYETRRDLVVKESNAIGTAILRARLVPAPAGPEIIRHLREYVEVRIALVAAGDDAVKLRAVEDRAAALQDLIWVQLVALGKAADQPPVLTGLLVQAVNDVIDIQALRAAADRDHVPSLIFWLLCILAAMSAGLAGYAYGLVHRRNIFPVLLACILISLVIGLIMDLHRAHKGTIRVSQQSMIDLRDSLDRITR
jgi:hypothetical protein